MYNNGQNKVLVVEIPYYKMTFVILFRFL